MVIVETRIRQGNELINENGCTVIIIYIIIFLIELMRHQPASLHGEHKCVSLLSCLPEMSKFTRRIQCYSLSYKGKR